MSGPTIQLQVAQNEPWLPFVLTVVAGFFLALTIHHVSKQYLTRLAKRTKQGWDDILIKSLDPAGPIVVFGIALWFALRYLAPDVPGPSLVWIDRLGVVLVAFGIAMSASRLTRAFLVQRAGRDPRWTHASQLGARLATAMIFVLALLLVLESSGVRITPLLASLGILGIAVALAMQDTLANFFAGVWIQSGKAVRPGHFIRLEEVRLAQGGALEGYVVEVGWRTTKLRTPADNIVVVPNLRLSQTVVTNFDLPEPGMALQIPVRVGSESEPARVVEIIMEEATLAAEDTPGILTDPPPNVKFIPGFVDHALELSLTVHVKDYMDQFEAQHAIRQRLWERFKREGIQPPP